MRQSLGGNVIPFHRSCEKMRAASTKSPGSSASYSQIDISFSSFANAFASRLPWSTSCLICPQMTIRRVFMRAPSALTDCSSPLRKSIHTDVSTSTLPFSPTTLDCTQLLLFGFSPVQVHQAATSERHELVEALSLDIVFHGSPYGFRAADALFDAHQFVNQIFINSNGRPHKAEQFEYRFKLNAHIVKRVQSAGSRHVAFRCCSDTIPPDRATRDRGGTAATQIVKRPTVV